MKKEGKSVKKKRKPTSITQMAGEYLVASELCKRDYVATTFTANISEFDILVYKNGKTFPVQVKTLTNKSGWQSNIRKWMDIRFKYGKQIPGKLYNIKNPNLVFIFAVLGKGLLQDQFFFLTKKEVQNNVCKSYVKNLKKHHYRRPNKKKSLHCSLTVKELRSISGTRDWDWIGKYMKVNKLVKG